MDRTARDPKNKRREVPTRKSVDKKMKAGRRQSRHPSGLIFLSHDIPVAFPPVFSGPLWQVFKGRESFGSRRTWKPSNLRPLWGRQFSNERISARGTSQYEVPKGQIAKDPIRRRAEAKRSSLSPHGPF
jgi:hypothetical protein